MVSPVVEAHRPRLDESVTSRLRAVAMRLRGERTSGGRQRLRVAYASIIGRWLGKPAEEPRFF